MFLREEKTTTRESLNVVSQKLEIGINLLEYDGDNLNGRQKNGYFKSRRVDMKSNKKIFNIFIELVLHASHYFIKCDIPISKYALENYNEIKHLDNWNLVVNKFKNVIRNESVCMQSGKLVKYLLDNKHIYLRKYPTDTLLEINLENEGNLICDDSKKEELDKINEPILKEIIRVRTAKQLNKEKNPSDKKFIKKVKYEDKEYEVAIPRMLYRLKYIHRMGMFTAIDYLNKYSYKDRVQVLEEIDEILDLSNYRNITVLREWPKFAIQKNTVKKPAFIKKEKYKLFTVYRTRQYGWWKPLQLERYHRRIYVDIETTTQGNNWKDGKNLRNKHIPFLVCGIEENGNTYKSMGPNCIKDFLDQLTGRNWMIIIHNLSYDGRFLIPALTEHDFGIFPGSKILTASGWYENEKSKEIIHFKFKDSYRLLPMKLSAMPKTFGIKNIEKEIMPYTLYTPETLKRDYVSIKEALKSLHIKDHKQFLTNIDKWNLIVDRDNVYHMKYAQIYCQQDCLVLKKAYNCFRHNIYGLTQLDIDTILTLPALSENSFIENGCYRGCYFLSRHQQEFFRQVIPGGVVMSANNEPLHIKGCIEDFDCTSEYPSAVVETGGVLKGKPKWFDTSFFGSPDNHLDEFDLEEIVENGGGWFAKCVINSIEIKRKFPLSSTLTDEGIRDYNDNPKEIVLSHIAYEDLIQYQHANIDIKYGYYFNEGRNNKIVQTMTQYFNERLKAKKNKNKGLSTCFKLIMNTQYGKCIQKSINTQRTLINANELDYQIINKIGVFKSAIKLSDSEWYLFERKKTLKEFNKKSDYTLCHFGAEILATAKRIMNRVMTLAEDNGINIYYTDTDSMHIDNSNNQIKKLAKLFSHKYPQYKPLIGKTLSQFHTDFSCTNPYYKVLHSIEFITFGKKCYVDKLKCQHKTIKECKEEGLSLKGISLNDFGKKIEYDYHFRMKGIPHDSVLEQLKISEFIDQKEDDLINKYEIKNKFKNVLDIYLYLYKKKKYKTNDPHIVFNLLANGKPSFEMGKDFQIKSRTEFFRKI